jgi:hypothetical protein
MDTAIKEVRTALRREMGRVWCLRRQHEIGRVRPAIGHVVPDPFMLGLIDGYLGKAERATKAKDVPLMMKSLVSLRGLN